MGKSPNFLWAMFNSYAKLPEGIRQRLGLNSHVDGGIGNKSRDSNDSSDTEFGPTQNL